MLERPQMQHSHDRWTDWIDIGISGVLSVLLFAASVPAASACDEPQGPPEAWADVSLDKQPTLFERRQNHPALADLDDLYLGQSRERAMKTIEQYCGDDIIERGEGMFGGEATFRGCRLDENETVKFVRVGFWPRLDGRVATLEVKRSAVPPPAVFRSARRLVESDPDNQVLRPTIVQLEYADYRFFADWDQGLDETTHLTVGFDPEIPTDRALPDR